MLPDHVQSQILIKSFWLGFQYPDRSRAELRAMAAEQLAAELAEQAKRQQHKPRSRRARAADAADPRAAPGALLARIFQLLDRIDGRRNRTPPAASPAPLETAPSPTTLGERISDKLHDLAEAVGISQPEEPPPKQYSLFASSDGIVREIAPDDSPHLTAPATRNYRRTTIECETSRDEKRGGTPRQSWLIG
jgi:hypothetical protein